VSPCNEDYHKLYHFSEENVQGDSSFTARTINPIKKLEKEERRKPKGWTCS
jgi:hypothetical protein